MLQRPEPTLTDVPRLIPLALLCGALVGLLVGALTSQVPYLRELGPELGRTATVVGAGMGGILAFLGLALSRRALKARTAFRFEKAGLTVTWPGFAARVDWSEVVGVEHRGSDLLVRVSKGPPLVLFGLADRTQAEALIDACIGQSEHAPAPQRAARIG